VINHAVIVLRDGKKILFIQRAVTKKSLPNVWAFPSGTVEEGETMEMTAIREAREELGIDIEVKKALATIELSKLGVCLHLFLCASKQCASIIFDLKEIQKIQWMTLRAFFEEYDDSQIGHGLIFLRKHPEIWKELQ